MIKEMENGRAISSFYFSFFLFGSFCSFVFVLFRISFRSRLYIGRGWGEGHVERPNSLSGDGSA